jgi:hypothetical protein
MTVLLLFLGAVLGAAAGWGVGKGFRAKLLLPHSFPAYSRGGYFSRQTPLEAAPSRRIDCDFALGVLQEETQGALREGRQRKTQDKHGQCQEAEEATAGAEGGVSRDARMPHDGKEQDDGPEGPADPIEPRSGEEQDGNGEADGAMETR